ncbi:substrate-binding periplasmic protein [Vibrio sp. HN007]|uniref:substrate-binding periplasmic protein n=1 Tax=Vibrio iocasae TaxID=3098914 RepID=UPI0035D4E5FC
MRKCYLGLISLSLSFALFASEGYSDEIRFITEPTTSMDTSGRSFSNESELTRELIQRLNQTNDIEVYPWKRAYSIMLTEPNVALFPTTRTEARENEAKWVGPLLKVNWVLFAHKDSDIKLDNLEDAMKVDQICGYLGDAKFTYLEKKGFKNLVARYRSFDCIELLARHRVDLWVSSTNALLWNIEADKDYLSEIKIVYMIDTKYLYYALSKDTPDETVSLLQETLNQMKKEGAFYKYYKEDFSEERIREFSKIEEPVFPWLNNTK